MNGRVNCPGWTCELHCSMELLCMEAPLQNRHKGKQPWSKHALPFTLCKSLSSNLSSGELLARNLREESIKKKTQQKNPFILFGSDKCILK